MLFLTVGTGSKYLKFVIALLETVLPHQFGLYFFQFGAEDFDEFSAYVTD